MSRPSEQQLFPGLQNLQAYGNPGDPAMYSTGRAANYWPHLGGIPPGQLDQYAMPAPLVQSHQQYQQHQQQQQQHQHQQQHNKRGYSDVGAPSLSSMARDNRLKAQQHFPGQQHFAGPRGPPQGQPRLPVAGGHGIHKKVANKQQQQKHFAAQRRSNKNNNHYPNHQNMNYHHFPKNKKQKQHAGGNRNAAGPARGTLSPSHPATVLLMPALVPIV